MNHHQLVLVAAMALLLNSCGSNSHNSGTGAPENKPEVKVATPEARPQPAAGTPVGEALAKQPQAPVRIQPDINVNIPKKEEVIKIPDNRLHVITPFDPSKVRMCIERPYQGQPLPPRTETAKTVRKINADGSISNIGTTRQGLAGLTEKMWEIGRTLRVNMKGGTAIVRSKVRQFATEWTKWANIKFDFVDDEATADIRIAFEKGKGSWSTLGRDALYTAGSSMNFGWFDDGTSDAEFSRVVIHEFGHALGLIHEHQSPAAGIAWDKDKAYQYYKSTQNWDKGQVDDDVLRKYQASTTNFSVYDPTSIMHYAIAPELTLNGQGTSWNYSLSNLDKEYIAKWYPFPPAPANANGMLRTGDDCDEIDFNVEYNVVPDDVVEFRLQPGANITWWKAIEVPINAGGYNMLEIQDGRSTDARINVATLDQSRPMRFWKAKAFGIHTLLGYRWDVLQALPGGTRVTLRWKRDGC